MTAEVYAMFKKTNPRVKKYEQKQKNPDNSDAKVAIEFCCSKEHRTALEEFVKSCNESSKDTAEIIESGETIQFKVVSVGYEFSDKIVRDFF